MPPSTSRRITVINPGSMITFTIISVIVIMFITSAIAALSLKSIDSLSTINLLSIQKNKEIKQLDNINGKVRELHSNVRDYVITRDSSYIRYFPSDKEVITTLLRDYSDSLTLSGKMKGDVVLLKSLIVRKIAFNSNVLKLYQYGGRDIALEFIETGKASVLNDSIELITYNIKDVENKELEKTVAKYNGAANQTKLTILTAAGFLILLGFLFMFTTVSNVRERGKIISELETAKNVSEKAALLKDQFVSNMSHEIRTPLNSIVGFTNLLNDTRLDKQQSDFVFTIKNASENLLRIVNDILDFSKIEAGMMHSHRHPFSPRDEIRIIERLFDHAERKKGLTLEFVLDPSLPDICVGDAVRLNQILVNLVSNAIKFTEKGIILVSVSVKGINDTSVDLEFKIKDTGIGIPQDKMSKIFDRFEQVDNEATRTPGGTGLGLSITKSLIEMEGGAIYVRSTEGKGTEFTFTMIYGLPEDGEPDKDMGRDKVPAVIFAPLAGKVLVAEDNPLNQKLIGTLLTKWQIDYEIASTGAEACSMLRQQAYSLVLMDIQMPEMDGYTATGIIRTELKLTIPVIALTAHSFDNSNKDFIDKGMNGYISKPFQEIELYQAIATYLKVKENTGRTFAQDQNSKLAEMEKTYGGDKAYIREMAEIFISQASMELNELEAAFSAGHFSGLAKTAHSMKSTVGYMGLYPQLEAILTRLENAEKGNHTLNELRKAIDQVRAVCLQTISRLQEELPTYIV